MSMESLFMFAVALIFIGIVIGFFVWAIRTAPFIPPQFKEVATWLVLVLGMLILIIAAWRAISGGQLAF